MFFSLFVSVFRNKLCYIFDACIKARKCKDGCGHKYKQVSVSLQFYKILKGQVLTLKVVSNRLNVSNMKQLLCVYIRRTITFTDFCKHVHD